MVTSLPLIYQGENVVVAVTSVIMLLLPVSGIVLMSGEYDDKVLVSHLTIL